MFWTVFKHVHAQSFSHLSFLNISYLCGAVMDSSTEEKKSGEEVSTAISTMKAKQTEETDQHTGKTRWHTLAREISF